MRGQIRHHLRLYCRLQLTHLRVSLEHPANFWIASVAMLLGELTTIGFVGVLFRQAPTIAGWRPWEVLFLYGLITLQTALGGFLCSGFWSIPPYVRSGRLDTVLVRPLSPLLQMATLHLDFRNVGRLVLSAIVLGLSLAHLPLDWKAGRIAFFAASLAGSALLLNALFLLPRCLVFWTMSDTNHIADWLWNFIDFAKYPLSAYTRPLQFLLTWLIPLAFITYYPAAVLLGKPLAQPWVGYLAPCVGPLAALGAVLVWRRGLARYQSAGH
jgi:ABC-2 type transport system permease protein